MVNISLKIYRHNHRVLVRWLNEGSATVKVSVQKDFVTLKEYTWTVNVKKRSVSPGGNPIYITLNGPTVMSVGDVATYSYSYDLKDKSPTWIADDFYFDIIESNDKDMKVRAKFPTVETEVVVSIRHHIMESGKPQEFTKGKAKVRIRPVYEVIQTSGNNICINGVSSYSIKNIAQTPGTKITWTANSNCTLISGQGSANASFKATANGSIKVTAVIEYNGDSYTLTNSNVWVGPPRNNCTIDGEYNTSTNLRYTYIVKGIESGVTVSRWDIKPPLTLVSSSATSVVVSTPSISANVPFLVANITGYLKNSCGETMISRQINIVNPKYKGPPIEEKSMPIEEPSTASIRIYSLTTGSIVYTEKNIMNFNIENTGLKKGIYVLEKTDGEGNVTRIKVAKQ